MFITPKNDPVTISSIPSFFLEKTLEGPLDCKEIQPVHSKGDQPWVFFGRNDAKAETPVLWPPQAKSWLLGKDPDPGRDWGQEEKGATEDEMAGWHHRLDGRESEWTPGVGDGQGGLACCDSWGRKESDTSERLTWPELNWTISSHPCYQHSPALGNSWSIFWLWVCLFWTFPVTGITQQVAFCMWLLLLSIMFSHFTGV